MGAFGVDDAVVIVEDFVDGDGDGEIGVCVESAVLGLEGTVVALPYDESETVLGVAEQGCSPTTKVSLGSSS